MRRAIKGTGLTGGPTETDRKASEDSPEPAGGQAAVHQAAPGRARAQRGAKRERAQ